MYLHAYGKSVIEIATNTIAFVTEFLPLGVTNLRPAFIVDFIVFFPRHEFCFNLEIMEQNCNTFGARSIPSIIALVSYLSRHLLKCNCFSSNGKHCRNKN